MTVEQSFPVALGFGVALCASLLFMPIAILLGRRWNAVVRPRLFGKRSAAIPYLGGPAVGLAAAIGILVVAGARGEMTALLVGGLLVLILGLADDRMTKLSMSPSLRLLLQLGVASGAWWTGLRAETGGVLGAIGTALFLMAAMNSFNLLDNMDGVAGWTAAAVSAGITGLALLSGQPAVAVLAACLCGACLGFLRYNFPNARIYLGNGGSLLVGFLVGVLALRLRLPIESPWGLMAIAVLLAVPAADTSVAIASRLSHGKPVMQGGTDHISHRLVRLGLRKRYAAMAHGFGSLLAAGLVAVASAAGEPRLLAAGVAVFAVTGVLMLRVRVYEKLPGRPIRRLVLASGVFLVAGGALAVPPVMAARGSLERAQAEMLRGAAAARGLDFATAETSFASAQTAAKKAEKELRSPLTWPARVIPVAGHNIRGAHALASGASYLIPAAQEGTDILRSLTGENGNGPVTFTDGQLSLDPIAGVRGRLEKAAAGARVGLARVNASSRFLLPPLAQARTRFLREAGQAVSGFDKAAQAAAVLPLLMGDSEPRTYFLMIQNSTEQRATGGFLGAFGILRAEEGRLSLERFESNLALPSGPELASPSEDFIQRYDVFGSNQIWQNVNMSPDFPTAAELVAGMWESRTQQRIDGVVAVDAIGLANLLSAVGPVSVPEWPAPLTAENFTRIALNEAYIRYPERPGRVDFLLGAGREIWTRLLGPRTTGIRPLAQSVAESFSGKHMQIWSREDETALKRLGIDGSLKPAGNREYLLVVGQNGAGNKVDYYARRRIDYEARIRADGSTLGRASVTLKNEIPASGLPRYITGPYSDRPDAPGLNRSYLSLYLGGGTLAKGARLDGKQINFQSHAELGHDVVSRFLEVLPGEASRFDVELRPQAQEKGSYRLMVERQAAIQPDDFQLSVRLPAGAVVNSMTPGMRRVGNVVRWQGALTADREFFISYGSSWLDRARRLLP